MCFQRDVFFVEMLEVGLVYKKRDTKCYTYELKTILSNDNSKCPLQTVHMDYIYRFPCHAHLYKISEYKPIIYTDETWVNVHYTKYYIWVDSDGKGPRKKGEN